MLGMSMGIALSNAYYPDSSVNGEEVAHPLWDQPDGERAGQSFAGVLARRSSEILSSQTSRSESAASAAWGLK